MIQPRPLNLFALLVATVLLVVPRAATAAPVVTNLSASQRPGTHLVDIAYDLFALGFLTVEVALEISSDGGTTWTVPAISATGDLGGSVAPGAGKVIVWDAWADWPGSHSDQMCFRLGVAGGVMAGFGYIPAGSFTMGRTSGDDDGNAPPTVVTVGDFYLAETETTKALWDEVRTWALANGYTDLAAGAGKAASHPVWSVSWWDVVKWCNARSEMEGLTAVYTVGGNVMRTGTTVPDVNWTANGYRLPTEAEWEKAARGGESGKRYPWGTDTISHAQANYYAAGGTGHGNQSGNVGTHPSYRGGGEPCTSPVGNFAANGYGLKDMSGNVYEWCWDWYGSSYYGTEPTDPKGPESGTRRVIRSGSWLSYAFYSRCSGRNHQSPSYTSYYIGFRTARSSVSFVVETHEVTVDTRRDNADLASLSLGDIVLSPDFATGTFAYTASVSNATASLTVTPTKAQADATIEARINGGDYSAVTSGSPSGALSLNVGPNTVEIRVTAQAGNTKTYTVILTRDKAAQTIVFANPGNLPATATVALTSIGGGSGNPVVFTATGPASLDGNILTFTGPGSVTVRANQAGNDNYHAAPEVSHTFTVTAAPATVTLGNLVHTYDGLPKTLSATTVPAALPVEIDYGGPAPVNAGTHPVTATITDPLYAGTASGMLVIEKAAQSIGFVNPGNQTTTATVNLSAIRGGSGNAVTFSATGPATISGGNILTFTGPGEVTVTASQAGNDNYHAAPQVSHTFNVTAATAILTLSRLHQVADGTAREVAVTTDPTDLEIEITYDGETDAPIAPGTYVVVASSTDSRYEGSASGTLVVDDPARMEIVPGGALPALSSLGELSVPTFRIGAYEVTGSQWAVVATWAEENAGYEFDGAGAAAVGDHPVTGGSWSDAAKWCNARTEWENIHLGRSLAPAYRVGGAVLKSGTPSPSEVECDFGAGGHRLPTAAEWEFAARGSVGGTPSAYPGGDDPDELGWHSGNSGGTQPAGGKTPNGLGLHDLAGNAAEWTWDGPSSDPAQRYLRGGSWEDGAAVGALSALSGADPNSRSVTVGFRLVQSISLALVEALDYPGLTWETGGDGLWIAQTSTTHDGEDAAESGASAQGQTSWLETTVEGPGNLRFQWKASGTEDADVLTLSVGGTEVLAQTGTFGWEEAFVEISEGPHILRWTHTRGASGSVEARAWLDSVAYEPVTGATVTTASAADVANTTATLGGEVLDDGGREVIGRGIVYGTASAPTLDSGTVLSADEGGTGPFAVDADGLSEGTTYHVRAYATSNLGTVYGEEIVFTTGATVTFTDGTATFGREILPGGRQRFGFTLAGPRIVSFATSGGAGLRAELLDAQGNRIAVFEEGGEIAFERLLLAGSYVLEISRPAGEGSAQGYTLLLDAGRVAAVRPEVSVGTAPTSLTGKLATVVSKKARPVKAHARVANRGKLPDVLAVRAGKGNALFKVVWLAPGNVTAALTTGRYRTATLGEGAVAPIQVSVKPNKKKLTKKKGKRKVIQKKTLNLPVTVWSSGDASLKDAATIRVRTK